MPLFSFEQTLFVPEGYALPEGQTSVRSFSNSVDEGYFDTGDLVEVDGDWIRFLGRESDIINVGGSKVHPAEVENVLLDLEKIRCRA